MESARIDATLLSQFTGQTVRICGPVTSVGIDASGNCTLTANGPITVSTDALQPEVGHSYEVVGLVQQDLSVRALQWFDCGPSEKFNAVAAGRLVDIANRLPELYRSSS